MNKKIYSEPTRTDHDLNQMIIGSYGGTTLEPGNQHYVSAKRAHDANMEMIKQNMTPVANTVSHESGMAALRSVGRVVMSPFYIVRGFWRLPRWGKALIMLPLLSAGAYMGAQQVKNTSGLNLTDMFHQAVGLAKYNVGVTPSFTHYVHADNTHYSARRFLRATSVNGVTGLHPVAQGVCVSVVSQSDGQSMIQQPSRNNGNIYYSFIPSESLTALPAGYVCPNAIYTLRVSGSFNHKSTAVALSNEQQSSVCHATNFRSINCKL